MKCPHCNETLVVADRKGVAIDYCPNCKGVWLDKGELEKIIEHTANFTSGENTGHYPDDRYRRDNYYNDQYYKQKKKKSFLSDFFDFS
jgi:Zn-finger nucleic acid-binding protein